MLRVRFFSGDTRSAGCSSDDSFRGASSGITFLRRSSAFIVPVLLSAQFIFPSYGISVASASSGVGFFATKVSSLEPPNPDRVEGLKAEVLNIESELRTSEGRSTVLATEVASLSAEKAVKLKEYSGTLKQLEGYRETIASYAKDLYVERGVSSVSEMSAVATISEGEEGVSDLTRKQKLSESFGGKEVEAFKKLESLKGDQEETLTELSDELTGKEEEFLKENGEVTEKSQLLAQKKDDLSEALEAYTKELLDYSCTQEKAELEERLAEETLSQSEPSEGTGAESNGVPSESTGTLPGSSPAPKPPSQVSSYTSGTQTLNGKKIWDFLIARGFSEEATAGILGNLDQESRFNPGATQIPSGPGRGLAQWSAGGRWDTSTPNLIKFAEANTLNPWALDTQLEFMYLEMSIGWGGFDIDKYKGMTDILEATIYFHRVYERSADSERFVRETRGGYSQKWYDLFKDTKPILEVSSGVSASANLTAVVSRDGDTRNDIMPSAECEYLYS